MINYEDGQWVLYDGDRVVGRYDTEEEATRARTAGARVNETVATAWKAKDASWRVTEVLDGVVLVTKDLMVRRVPYTVEGAAVNFGTPAEVEVRFEEVGEAAPIGQPLTPSGSVWDVRVLKFGRSLNGWLWTREAGEKLLPLLGSAPVGCYVYQNGVAAHAQEEAVMAARGPMVRNVVADLQSPRLEADGVYARLHIHEDAGWLRTKLLGLQARGVVDKVLGLSIDTLAGYVPVQLREGAAKAIKEIGRLISVDIVTAPSADGRFIRATAGPLFMPHTNPQEAIMTREQLLALIQANRPQLLAGRALESLTDDTLQMMLADAIKLAAPVSTAVPSPPVARVAEVNGQTGALQENLVKTLNDLDHRYNVATTQARVIEALSGATSLPEIARDRIRKRFADRVADMSEIAAEIADERKYLARISESGEIRGHGQTRSEILAAPLDKVQAAMDRMFFEDVEAGDLDLASSLKNSPFNPRTKARLMEQYKARDAAMRSDPGLKFKSLREAYTTITGDDEVTGQVIRGRASEAILSTGWADILGNTLYRRILMDYSLPQYNERSICEFGSAPDFRTREVIHMNYFADISTVDPEAADYAEIAAVGDDKVSYAVTQRGNILTISRKTIINDDLRAVTRLVARLGRSARRTLAKFIWAFWNTNSVFDVDTVAWFNAAHGANTGTTALSADAAGAAAVRAAITALMNMTEPGSGEKLGAPDLGGTLWLDVPIALWAVADALNRAPEFGAGVKNLVSGLFGANSERVNTNPLFTDTTDWGVHLSPGTSGRSSLGVDFLGGREEPEFFLADQPTVGQAFIADKIQYKIRHEYGGDLLDYRAAYKSVVVGA